MAGKNFALNAVLCQELSYIYGGCSCVCRQLVNKASGQGESPVFYDSIKEFRESKYQKGVVLLTVSTNVDVHGCGLKCSNMGLSMQECIDMN